MTQGGWYEGKQYWNGQLGAPGVVMDPSASGYGKSVSNEVIAQTNPDNVAYIQSLKANTTEAVTQDINNFQSNLFASSSRPETKVPTMAELKSTLAPSTPAPEPLNRVAKFEELRTSQGVADLEKTLTDLKAQEEQVNANLRIRKAGEEGKPVAMGVISGRVSEVEKQERENLDFVQRQKSRVVEELNTKYNVINTYMNFYGLDYADSVNRYDKEFQQNIDMYQIITGRQDAQMDSWEKDRANASANLTLMMNAVTAGNMDYSSMSADQKLMVSKLETQAGMPIGTMASIKADPKANILFTTTDSGVTQVGFRMPDGTVSVQSYGTSTKVASEYDQNKSAIADMAKTLTELGGSDYLVSPHEWKDARATWINAGFIGEDFDKNFASQYTDQSKPQLYGLSAY